MAEHVHGVIERAESELCLEQAVYGLDSRDERALQQLLADGLREHYEVAREVHYPSSAGRKLSERQRCDLVLTPRGRALRPDSRPPDLFDPHEMALPGEGLWLEVKVAYQYRLSGVRHPGYGAQWRDSVVADLLKMEADPLVREAGLLLVVFNESEQILQKDLDLFEAVLAQKEVLAGFRHVRSVPILERIGHCLCTTALWPTIQR